MLRILVETFMQGRMQIATFTQTVCWCCIELLISLGVNPLLM